MDPYHLFLKCAGLFADVVSFSLLTDGQHTCILDYPSTTVLWYNQYALDIVMTL